MYRLKLSNVILSCFVISALVLTVVIIIRANIRIEKIANPDSISLPISIKDVLLNDPYSHLLYIEYQKRSLRYYYLGSNDRADIVLRALRDVITSIRYKIPQGRYLLVLHDGGNFAYEMPFLAFAAQRHMVDAKKVVLIPDVDALKGYDQSFLKMHRAMRDYPWSKKSAKIFWRGSATGAGSENNDLDGFPRIQFLNRASNTAFVDAGFTNYTRQFNPQFEARLRAKHALKPYVTPEESLRYKYLLDIDGNSCSYSRMAWILYSNSLLMKHQSDEMQWYYDAMQPYVHYIPIARDFSDLSEQFAWAQNHPERSLQIARQGHDLAKRIFTRPSVLQSLAAAFSEYAKIRDQ